MKNKFLSRFEFYSPTENDLEFLKMAVGEKNIGVGDETFVEFSSIMDVFKFSFVLWQRQRTHNVE